MPPDEARRQALLKFGNVALVKEDTRAVWTWSRFDELWSTTRIAARTWRRTPVLATAIVVTLALAMGRLFHSGDDKPGAEQTVVLSHGYWQRRFAGRPDVVGRSMTIENAPHTVIGVLSPEFPLSGSMFAGAAIDMYLPLTIDGNNDIGGFMAVIGRLRPGVTASQARAELASHQVALSTGKWEWMTVLAQHVTPLPDLVTRTARSPVLLLLGGIGCVLLMACANLANLLLVRASGRRREFRCERRWVRPSAGCSARWW
jgi:MacB-like protein